MGGGPLNFNILDLPLEFPKTRFSWGSLGISKQFLKTAPWKCIIFTPSLGISEPFGRRHPSLPGISK
jgi:hypothetical protein